MAQGQETTGSLEGYIYDQNQKPIAFATIKLVDLETNSVTGAISQENGFYSIQNLMPAIYTSETSFVGYKSSTTDNIRIKLGSALKQDIILEVESYQLEELTISSTPGENKISSDFFITKKLVEKTPTILRSLQELTRAIPVNNLNSFGGASHRFNNLNIDGIATNDVIGFQEPASGAAGSQASGTPGSLAKTQPISFGAIKELSIKLAPFDVSIGNFNGANIDLITKNGTNKRQHSVYAFGNNQSLLGSFADGIEQPKNDFSDYQLGFSTGGAIKKDKLFYFLNVEYANSRTPLLNAPGTAGSNISRTDIDLIRNKLQDDFDYDPGAFENAEVETASTKIFSRIDYTLNAKHKLTLRNNYVSGFADNLEWNANFFNFGNQGFRHHSTANSSVLELKSNFDKLFNNLKIGYNLVRDNRDFTGRIFPHLQIATSSSERVFAGTYREASVFNTDFSTLQLSDKLSYIKDSHNFTVGFLAQIHEVDYGFLSAWNGRWEYRSTQDFLDDRPSRIRGVYNVNEQNNNFDFVQNNPAASIGIFESAFYIQDRYNVSSRLDVTAGIRLDGQFLTSDLPVSTLISSSADFNRFDNKLNNNIQINPRLGFNYNFENIDLNLRGGTGLFSGKLPYLWLGYIEYISGTEYFNIDIKPTETFPLVEDLGSLREVQPGLTEVNLLDPDFKFPRDWKTNIGFDLKLKNSWNFSVDASYTKVIQGLLFQTLNRNEQFSNLIGADTRVIYDTSGEEVKVNPNFTNVFLLTNTQKGFRYNLSFNLAKQTNGFYTNLGYSYGLSKDASSTVRSSPAANYEWNQAVFGNDPELSFSNYDLRHKFVWVQSYTTVIGSSTGIQISMLLNSRSGSPYSFVYQGDLNKDGSSRNDLVYVPRNATEINLIDRTDNLGNTITAAEQWTALDDYINNIDYLNENRGNIVERNGAKTPWNHQLDMKIELSQQVMSGNKLTFSLDIFNVLNLVNRNWGTLVFVPNVVNSSVSLLELESIDALVPSYTFNLSPDETPWVTDTFNSRWRMQLGVKYDF